MNARPGAPSFNGMTQTSPPSRRDRRWRRRGARDPHRPARSRRRPRGHHARRAGGVLHLSPDDRGGAVRRGPRRTATSSGRASPSEFDARLVQDAVAEVAPTEQAVRTGAGKAIPYDHLVLATGARATPAYAHAITFGEDRRGGGAARAAPRRRGGLRRPHRLRGAQRDDVGAAALRARADDGAPGLEHGRRSRSVPVRDPRGAAAGHLRRARRATPSPSCSSPPRSSSSAPPTPRSSTAT